MAPLISLYESTLFAGLCASGFAYIVIHKEVIT